MTYLPAVAALGDLDTSAPINFVTRSGICKPSDFPSLYIFQEMQHQLDRVAQGMNIAKIACDGDIGPATLSLVAKTGPFMMVNASDCSSVAQNAATILSQAKTKADGMGVPDKVTTPITVTAPSITTSSGATIKAPPMPPVGAGASVMDTFKSLGTVGMIAAGAAVVGVGYMLTKKKGRR